MKQYIKAAILGSLLLYSGYIFYYELVYVFPEKIRVDDNYGAISIITTPILSIFFIKEFYSIYKKYKKKY